MVLRHFNPRATSDMDWGQLDSKERLAVDQASLSPQVLGKIFPGSIPQVLQLLRGIPPHLLPPLKEKGSF